jgi:hypothetical protein
VKVVEMRRIFRTPKRDEIFFEEFSLATWRNERRVRYKHRWKNNNIVLMKISCYNMYILIWIWPLTDACNRCGNAPDFTGAEDLIRWLPASFWIRNVLCSV